MEEHIGIYAILVQDLMKRAVCRCGSRWASIKLKPGRQIGGRLLTATHLDQSLRLANDRDRQSDHTYYTLLWQVLCCCTLQKCWAKSILLSQTRACFEFSWSNSNFAGWHTEQSWSCFKLSLLFAKNLKRYLITASRLLLFSFQMFRIKYQEFKFQYHNRVFCKVKKTQHLNLDFGPEPGEIQQKPPKKYIRIKAGMKLRNAPFWR